MVQTELSHLRTLAGWIGKPGLVLPAESYASDPALVARRYVATEDRSWPAHGVDPDALIEGSLPMIPGSAPSCDSRVPSGCASRRR